MKLWILATLLCGALVNCPISDAKEPSDSPETAPKSDAAQVQVPQQGPQETASSEKAERNRAHEDGSAGKVITDETYTTTSATTSSSDSTDTAAPDKPFTAKANAQHNGSFNYSIDVKEPDFRGLEPNIALDYDSSQTIANNAAHQNWLGLGWSMRGFSVIERASPGRGAPFFNDAYDTYLLDGMEMVSCTGITSPGCSAGGTHALRVENYQRIVRDATDNSWTVILTNIPASIPRRWGTIGSMSNFTKANTLSLIMR
jgi:hypothetical protein